MVGLNGKRVLVTGGLGFLGSSLVGRLVSQGNDVTVFDAEACHARTTLAAEGFQDYVRCVRGDVRSPDDLLRLGSDDWDYVFHLAAQPVSVLSNIESKVTMEINGLGTSNVCAFLARYAPEARFVLASSACVYGIPAVDASPLREDDPQRQGFYAYTASKRLAEAAVRDALGIRRAVARFVNLYGPGDRHFSRLIPKIIRQLQRREQVRLTRGTGDTVLDFLYVSDAVDALILIGSKTSEAAAVPTYNFGVGAHHARPIRRVAQAVLHAAGVEAEVSFPTTANEPLMRKFLDPTSAHKDLGWFATVELTEGLARTVDWYSNHLDRIDPLEDVALPVCLQRRSESSRVTRRPDADGTISVIGSRIAGNRLPR